MSEKDSVSLSPLRRLIVEISVLTSPFTEKDSGLGLEVALGPDDFTAGQSQTSETRCETSQRQCSSVSAL